MSGTLKQEKLNDFQLLIEDIKRILGPSSGIDAADIDTKALMDLLKNYKSDPEHWGKYAFKDSSFSYTRNGVSHINSKANLLVLVWTPGRSSAIHDHANAHCIVKVLKGSLRETIYKPPVEEHENSYDTNSNSSGSNEECKAQTEPAPDSHHETDPELCDNLTLEFAKVTDMHENEITYMSDKIGLHSMANLGSDYAVSLHLYTPPWAAKYGCHIYNPKSGKKRLVSMSTLYSDNGVKTES